MLAAFVFFVSERYHYCIASTESTTATTASTESTTILTTTESTTASASESVTTSATLSSASTESTTISTTTASTTTSAVQSTTTSAEPEPQETNLIVNGGFEASTPQPWNIFHSRNPGSLGVATDQFYEGQQSGSYEHSDNVEDEYWGIYQAIDKTRLVLGERYLVTIRIRVPTNSCPDIFITPSFGDGGLSFQSQSFINVGNAVNNWHEAQAMFRYTQQQQINNAPGVAIISQCESVAFWIDDISMVRYVEPTTD